MTDWTGNVVLTRAASEALRREFIGWQCRLRQLAAREYGGRPGAGMRPRVVAEDGSEISPGIVTLIIESEPENSTELFRYRVLKTQDPERTLRQDRRDSSRKLFSGAEPFLGSHDGAVRTALRARSAALSRGGAASSTSSNTARAIAFPARSRGSPRVTRSIRRPTGTTGCSIPIFPPPWRFSRSVRIGPLGALSPRPRGGALMPPANITPRRRDQNLR